MWMNKTNDLYIVEVWATDAENLQKHIDSVFAMELWARDRARQAVKEIIDGTYTSSERYKVYLSGSERVFATVTLVHGDDNCRGLNDIVFGVDGDGNEFEPAEYWLYDLVEEDPYWDIRDRGPEEA